MNMFLFSVILVIFLIWNSFALGLVWKDGMTIGMPSHKFFLWIGLAQNVAAFSLLTLSSVYWLFNGAGHSLHPSDIGAEVQIFLLISTSMVAVTAHMLRSGYSKFEAESLEKKGWRNYRKMHNMTTAAAALGNAFVSPTKIFSEAVQEGDSALKKLATCMLVLLLITAASGFFIAFGLLRYFMSARSARIEIHMKDLIKRVC